MIATQAVTRAAASLRTTGQLMGSSALAPRRAPFLCIVLDETLRRASCALHRGVERPRITMSDVDEDQGLTTLRTNGVAHAFGVPVIATLTCHSHPSEPQAPELRSLQAMLDNASHCGECRTSSHISLAVVQADVASTDFCVTRSARLRSLRSGLIQWPEIMSRRN